MIDKRKKSQVVMDEEFKPSRVEFGFDEVPVNNFISVQDPHHNRGA
jgi:hypothetical protein